MSALRLVELAPAGARRGPPSLAALAGAVAGLENDDALVLREGSVARAGRDHAIVTGLGPALLPGDLLEIGDAIALVDTSAPDGVRAIPDRSVRPSTPVRSVPRAIIRPDASWRGRTLDARLQPLDGSPPPRPAYPRTGGRGTTVAREVTIGHAALDTLCAPRSGEVWAVVGPAGCGRTQLLEIAAHAERDDSVVRAALSPRRREVARMLTRPNATGPTILGTRMDGPAVALHTLRTAIEAAAWLAGSDEDGETLLLVDNAERVPSLPLRDAVRTASESGACVLLALREPPDWVDGAVHLTSASRADAMPAPDWHATLASSPPPDDRAARAAGALRALAAEGPLPGDLACLLAGRPGDALSIEAIETALGLGPIA